MTKSKDCPKCAGAMLQGFVADQTHGTSAVPNWVEGEPRKSPWRGLQLSGKPRSEISTWRCRRCGFLESYALSEPDLREEQETKAQVRMLLLIISVVAGIMLAIALFISSGR